MNWTTDSSDPSNLPIAISGQERIVRRELPAWLLSFLLHGLILLAAFLMLAKFHSGAGEVENRTGGIVLVDISSETTEYLSEGDVAETAAESAQQPPPMPASQELPPNLPGMAFNDSQLTGVGEETVDSLTGAESLLQGTTSDRPFGGKVTTEVFGVKGTGSTFVYVFDRSASMEDLGGRPLRAAKSQLLESLNSLGETHQFQIIFYNDETKVFQPDPGQSLMTFADEPAKKRARKFIASIGGKGGTDHLKALKLALSFAPDVVFLLTDAEGGFTSSELRSLSNWNRSGAVINAIEFGVGGQGLDRSLQRVATESTGQYVYKDVRSFRD